MDTLDNANTTTNPFANSNNPDILSQKEAFVLNLADGFKHNGMESSPAEEFLARPTNGKRSADEFDDDDDLGPETDVDAIDDILLSPTIAKNLVEGIANNNPIDPFDPFYGKEEKAALETDSELQKQQTSEFDPVKSPREETPTPPADSVHDTSGLVDNVAESGEDSDDEWNYFKGDTAQKENIPPSQADKEVCKLTEAEENLDADKMSQLNPNAAEFIPVSPKRNVASPYQTLVDDSVIAQSPRRGLTNDIDISVPNPQEFACEIKSRPSDVKEYPNGDEVEGSQKLTSQEIMQNLLNGKSIDEIEFQPTSPAMRIPKPEEFHFGPNSTPFSTPAKFLDQSEALSTKAVFGDESTASYLEGKGLDGSFASSDAGEPLTFGKEQDPMSMSFYQDKDDDANPFDLNKVQELPENLDDFLEKSAAENSMFNDTISDLPEHNPAGDIIDAADKPLEELDAALEKEARCFEDDKNTELDAEYSAEPVAASPSPSPLPASQSPVLLPQSPILESKSPLPPQSPGLASQSPLPISSHSPLPTSESPYPELQHPESPIPESQSPLPTLQSDAPLLESLLISGVADQNLVISPTVQETQSPVPISQSPIAELQSSAPISPSPVEQLNVVSQSTDLLPSHSPLPQSESLLPELESPLLYSESPLTNAQSEVCEAERLVKSHSPFPESSHSPIFQSHSPLSQFSLPEDQILPSQSQSKLFDARSSVPQSHSPLPESQSPLLKSQSPLPEPQSLLPESRSPLLESQTPLPESRSPLFESQSPFPETRSPLLESKSPLPELQSPILQSHSPLPEIRSPVCELQSSPLHESHSSLTESRSPLLEAQTLLSESKSPLPESQSSLPVSQSPLPVSQSPLPLSQSPLPESQSPLPKSQSPLPESRSPPPKPQSPLPESKSLLPESQSPLLQSQSPIPPQSPIQFAESPVPSRSPLHELESPVEDVTSSVKDSPLLAASPVDHKITEELKDEMVIEEQQQLPDTCSVNYNLETANVVEEDITTLIEKAASTETPASPSSEHGKALEEILTTEACSISTPKSVESEQVDVESVVTADVNSFLERSSVPDIASPLSLNSEPVHDVSKDADQILDAFTSKLEEYKVEEFVQNNDLAALKEQNDIKIEEQVTSGISLDVKSEIIAPEFPIPTAVVTPSEESKADELIQNEVTAEEKKDIVEEAAVTAGVAAVAATAVAATTAAVAQKKSSTSAKPKSGVAAKKPSPKPPTSASPTKTAPAKMAAKPAAAPRTTMTSATQKVGLAAKTTPTAKATSSAKPAPKPKPAPTAAAKSAEKKPLMNGDAKPAAVKKVPPSTASKAPAKSVPSKLSPTKTESRSSTGSARPATAPAKTTTSRHSTSSSRPTTLTRTITSNTTKTTTLSSVTATKSTTKTPLTSPKAPASAPPRAKPAATSLAKPKLPATKPAPKAPDTEKQIKETANKQITMSERKVTAAKATTTAIRKTTDTKAPPTRTSVTKTTTTLKADAKKPMELIHHTTTKTKAGVITKKTKTQQNGVVTELTTITVATTNAEPQLVKDVSPVIESIVFDNSQVSEANLTD